MHNELLSDSEYRFTFEVRYFTETHKVTPGHVNKHYTKRWKEKIITFFPNVILQKEKKNKMTSKQFDKVISYKTMYIYIYYVLWLV